MTDDFAVPVTDAFLDGVRREVRRRRRWRAVAAGGAVAATVLTAALVVTVARPPATGSIAVVPPAASAGPAHRPVDGYRVTFVPAGLRPDDHGDGYAGYAVSKDQLHNDRPAPATDHPTAATTMRLYLKANGGMALWITVLRPERTTAAVGRAQVTAWLTGWSVKNTQVIDRYPVPAGQARLIRTGGAGTTVHEVVITTPDGVVITVAGSAEIPLADLKAVAAGLVPQ